MYIAIASIFSRITPISSIQPVNKQHILTKFRFGMPIKVSPQDMSEMEHMKNSKSLRLLEHGLTDCIAIHLIQFHAIFTAVGFTKLRCRYPASGSVRWTGLQRADRKFPEQCDII
jgi:hypothetical protein